MEKQKNKIIILIIAVISVFYNCKKNAATPPPTASQLSPIYVPPSTPNYTPLVTFVEYRNPFVGNYNGIVEISSEPFYYNNGTPILSGNITKSAYSSVEIIKKATNDSNIISSFYFLNKDLGYEGYINPLGKSKDTRSHSMPDWGYGGNYYIYFWSDSVYIYNRFTTVNTQKNINTLRDDIKIFKGKKQ